MLAACAGQREGNNGHIVYDSSGVMVVVSYRPAMEGGSCQPASTPAVRVGAADDPDYQLFGVVGASRLSNGGLVIADRGSQQLRFYDSLGTYAGAAGGRGGGPGEFRALSQLLRLSHDTLLAYDGLSRRLSLFSGAAKHVRDVMLKLGSSSLRLLQLVGRFGDGTVVGAVADRSAPIADSRTELARDSVHYVRFGEDGVLLDTVVSVVDEVIDVRVRDLGAGRALIPFPVHFTPEARAVARDRVLFAANGEQYDIAVYDTRGHLLRLIRREHTPIAVRADDVARLLDDYRSRFAGRPVGEIRREMGLLESAGSMDVFPAFDRFSVDLTGALWVRRYGSRNGSEYIWDGFSEDGRWQCTLTLDEHATLLEVGSQHLIVVEQDSLGVETVAVFPFLRW
jgi:hypothetical protein